MDEREFLVEMAALSFTEFFRNDTFFKLLLLYDSKKENAELLESIDDIAGRPEEHREQIAIDGVAVSVKATKDVLDKINEMFCDENVELATKATVEDYLGHTKGQL